MKDQQIEIEPFDNCPALDGYHCQSSSLAKIYHHFGHPLSEDMILGLGAGMGFIYWQMKIGDEKYVFIGGRGNTKEFFKDLGKRTGVKIEEKSTSSMKKAEASLMEKLAASEPIMLFGDMGFLPWFDLPDDYHFGGHTFVVCGFDGSGTVLASDIDQKASGLKEGFYYPMSLEQLSRARGSKYKPFPPKNTYLEFDFAHAQAPGRADIIGAIRQTIESQVTPQIKNVGVPGLKKTSKEILKWPKMFNDKMLRMNLFSLYIFFEIGGTGGGCFRYMFSRFLKEASKIVEDASLEEASAMFAESGRGFSEIGMMFKEAETMTGIDEQIGMASERFAELSEIEGRAFDFLSQNI